MKDQEQNKRLNIDQARELLNATSLSDINNMELEDLLNAIQIFCEINYEIYKDKANIETRQKDFISQNEIFIRSENDIQIDNAA